MENEKSLHLYKLLASIIILIVLVSQASLIPARVLTGWSGEWYWPFIDYPMYDQAHYENDSFEDPVLEVTHKDGEIVKLTEDDLGLSFWNFFVLTSGMKKDENKAIEIFLNLYPNRDEVSEIRMYSPPYTVTKQGKTKSEPLLLHRITL